jgi:RNA-directed DNA polymerase
MMSAAVAGPTIRPTPSYTTLRDVTRSAGVDGRTAYHVEQVLGVERFLGGLREQLRSGTYRPVAVRERMIPKRGGKRRRLGIPTVADRVVQAALKTVLEPIFEPPRGSWRSDSLRRMGRWETDRRIRVRSVSGP